MTAVQPTGHDDRVKKELTDAGMNKYGFLKGETRHLPSIIQDDEHIGGVVYGRGQGASGMLVATNKRILFLDHKLFFKKTEEISYDAVSGISYNKQGEYSTVILHTKFGDFTLRFVNVKIGTHFVNFIENIRVTKDKNKMDQSPIKQEDIIMPITELSGEAKIFLNAHDVGVISTIDKHGNVHGAAVYYTVGTDDEIFFVAKSKTEKAQDLLTYHQIALTIYDAQSMETLQITGTASIEQDKKLAESISHRVLRPRLAGNRATVPPILHISAGEYVVICIKPTQFKYRNYKSW